MADHTIEDRLGAVEWAVALLLSDFHGRAEALGIEARERGELPPPKDGVHAAFRRLLDMAERARAE